MRIPFRTDQRIPIRRPHWNSRPPYMLPSGLMVVDQGRRSIRCEMGMHKWSIDIAMGVPFMICSRCGYLVPKPTVERTASKREVVRHIQKEMDKKQPRLPTLPVGPDEMAKAKERFYVEIFERVQREYRKKKTGKLVHVGARR